MNTAIRTLETMIIALAMIGMTGFAMANTTTANFNGDGSYNMDFNGIGTGSMDVFTHTSTGFDHMGVGWTDTNVNGWQNMDTSPYGTGAQSEIERDVTVGIGGHGQDASGQIQTYTTDGGDNSVYTSATYHDDVAGGSNVRTIQDIFTRVTSGCVDHDVNGDITITGFAYGDDTLVTGLVQAHSDNVSTQADMKMTEGKFTLATSTRAYTADCWYTGAYANLIIRNMAGVGLGNATIAGGADVPAMADFSLDGTNDAAGYHINGTADDLTSMNIHNDFDYGYTGTGYIYVYNETIK